MPRDLDDSVEQSPSLHPVCGNIDVLPRSERMLAQDRVAVVAAGVDRVLSISEMRPDFVGQEFELRLIGPLPDPSPMHLMVSEDLLKKNEVGMDFPNRLANGPEDELAVV